MSEREWKPGDVAMYEYLSSGPLIALRIKGGYSKIGGDACPDDMHDRADHWHLSNGGWTSSGSKNVHGPLVVIDPEDAEEVERLCGVLLGAVDVAHSDVAAALREFANPKPPKPDEPTGLGAVVEDTEGQTWLRDWRGMWCAPDVNARWPKVDAVRILSHGVTEEEQ